MTPDRRNVLCLLGIAILLGAVVGLALAGGFVVIPGVLAALNVLSITSAITGPVVMPFLAWGAVDRFRHAYKDYTLAKNISRFRDYSRDPEVAPVKKTLADKISSAFVPVL